MSNNVEKFLQEYKTMEQKVRLVKGKEIKEIEEGLDEGTTLANKLRMCRQLRNFISHNEYNGFITIDKGMIKFIKEFTKTIKPNTKTKTNKPKVSKIQPKAQSKKATKKNKIIKKKERNEKCFKN